MSFLPPSSASGNQLTASLRQDHDIIKKVLKATSAFIELLKEGKEIPTTCHPARYCRFYYKLYRQMCHHAKEEQGLFPALETTGMPRENSAIGTMLRGHEEARKIAEQIKSAVDSYLANNKSEQSRSALIQHCEECVNHIDRHILKDDTRLFIIAERHLRGKENVVKDMVGSVEIRELGIQAKRQYEEKANQLFLTSLQGLRGN